MQRFAGRWMRYWFKAESPTNLAICRILFFGGLLACFLPHDFSSWGEVSEAFWMPTWTFRALGLPLLSKSTLAVIQIIWKVSLALSCLGLFTRASTTVAFGLGFYLLGLPHNLGKIHHTDGVVVIVLGILWLSRCGDVMSLDRLRQRNLRPAEPGGEYRWPIRAVWLTLSLVFFAAGVTKLRASGLDWVFSETMEAFLIAQHHRVGVRDPLVDWGLTIAGIPWLCRALAGTTLLVEVSYPLALASRGLRVLLVPAMVLILLSIRILMGPDFALLILAHVFWVPWKRFAAVWPGGMQPSEGLPASAPVGRAGTGTSRRDRPRRPRPRHRGDGS